MAAQEATIVSVDKDGKNLCVIVQINPTGELRRINFGGEVTPDTIRTAVIKELSRVINEESAIVEAKKLVGTVVTVADIPPPPVEEPQV